MAMIEELYHAKLQSELGVYASTLYMRDIQLEAAAQQHANDKALIEALTKRALDAEQANRELKDMIRPTLPRGDVPHAADGDG